MTNRMTTITIKPCGHILTKDGCRVCHLYESSEVYRRRWSAPVGHRCVHRGDPTGQAVECPSCGGHVRIKLFGCGIHGTCTTERQVAGHGCCAGCPDVATAAFPPGGPRRNILFHLYPLRGRWFWHADWLRRTAELFNGRRIIAVSSSEQCDPVEAVRDLTPGYEIINIPNDPSLREVATFEPLFGSLTAAPNEVTLYAQSKAVTHEDMVFWRWAEILWETYTGYWPVVESLLRKFPVAGSFLKIGRGWPEHLSLSEWHYSGSWFWFRNADLLGKPDWRRIDRNWTGIEPYPSLHFPVEQAGCIFFRGLVPTLQFYEQTHHNDYPTGRRFLNKVVEPQYEEWKAANAGRRTV